MLTEQTKRIYWLLKLSMLNCAGRQALRERVQIAVADATESTAVKNPLILLAAAATAATATAWTTSATEREKEANYIKTRRLRLNKYEARRSGVSASRRPSNAHKYTYVYYSGSKHMCSTVSTQFLRQYSGGFSDFACCGGDLVAIVCVRVLRPIMLISNTQSYKCVQNRCRFWHLQLRLQIIYSTLLLIERFGDGSNPSAAIHFFISSVPPISAPQFQKQTQNGIK